MAGPAIDVLANIHDAEVNLTVWHRRLDGTMAAEALALLDRDGEPLRLEVSVARLSDALERAMTAANWSHAPRLVADMAFLAHCFGDVMACDAVDLRLEVIAGDACRKYHADYVTARLITSYAGPGTQWISDGDAAALAAGAPAEQVVPHQLQPGEVALFKGRRWSDRPIIHRSPPIAGSGQRRLVLVINPIAPDSLA